MKPSCGRVHIEDLWVDLGPFHLHQIGLDVAPGEYFVVLGPTGAGKTVLLEAIAGLHQIQSGRMIVGDRDVTSLPPERREIGFVYQDYALFPHLSVAENIAFGLRVRGLDRPVIEEKVAAMGELLNIAPLLGRRPGTLSGGEQQRVALARALVVEPRVLLLDEPLSALDPATREGLQRELARLHGELGTTTLHVTHDFEEAATLGERLAVLNEGRIVQVGSPAEVFRRPASEFVARFVEGRNIFEGHVEVEEDGQQVLSVAGLRIGVMAGFSGRAHGMVRPEDIQFSRQPLRSGARNAFRGRVAEIVDRGTIIYVSVDVETPAGPLALTGAVTRTSLEELGLREGGEVYVAFKVSAVHVFQ